MPVASPGVPRAPWWSSPWLTALLLVLLTAVVYLPAMRAGYLWDDDVYLTANPHLRSLSGLSDIWFRIGTTKMYVPMVFTTFWVEHHLWGLEPLGYHLVNLAFHAAAVVLLWTLFRRLALRGAWFAAALFAVHPVIV